MPVVQFDWDEIEDNIDEEFDGNGNSIAEYTTEPDYHGNVISQLRDGVTSTFHHDGVGSTIAVTNDAGEVTDTLAYGAFGTVTARSGTSEFPFQFVGQRGYYFDVETNSYSIRRRSFHPVIARWLCVDPMSVAFGYGAMVALDPASPRNMNSFYGHEFGMSLIRRRNRAWQTHHPFTYTDNNPVNRVDPSGLDWLDDITDNAFYKWLYTGDPNIDSNEYRLCCEPAGAYVTCHVKCMADVNKQLLAIAAGGVGAGVNARDVLPFPKWLASHLGFRVSGQSWFTSLARLKSTHPERFCIPRGEREAWKQLANQIKSRPGAPGTQVREIVRRGARGGIAAVAVLELLIALYCMDQCD